MTTKTTQMRREIEEIPVAVDRLLSLGAADIARAAEAVRALDPAYVITVARGSSDHVCTYLKYATELMLGVPVASVGPSVASIYGAPLRLAGSLCVSVSQSGQSPDIVEMARAARRGDALSVAITNNAASPLAEAAHHTLNMQAGPELSVAATKTFVTSAVAGLMLLADWKGDAELAAAIRALPRALEDATAIDWPDVRAAISDEQSLFTLGRGPAWAISNEAALKFKETCQIHAESYSSAEVLHGPVSIVDEGFPVLAFAAGDAAEDALVGIADQIAGKGANVFVTSDRATQARTIAHRRTDHPLTDPISLITSFYAMVEKVATGRGIDPDTPRHLKKVTETV
ncbi:SIS domain-containing protein [Aliiroseovarius subalbicans]|uniref:SIS domain-containing protein n=1 Tax=Aliiroseovarius subalbicans TaxID=2925840 RepID=UPI001F56D02D|nr:SIS domain-containing protein [Aliiroseovarius subalbicans]MCI2397774.1 SIS domain-containing protein [Aliiroseovarius subalbicans]